MATHSSTLAWKISWAEESGMLQSMGWRTVGHIWVTSLSLFTSMHWRMKWQPTPVFLPGESQGEPGGLPSLGSHRVRHDWSNLAAAAAALGGHWPFCTLRDPLKDGSFWHPGSLSQLPCFVENKMFWVSLVHFMPIVRISCFSKSCFLTLENDTGEHNLGLRGVSSLFLASSLVS